MFLSRFFADDIHESTPELIQAMSRAEIRSVDERVGQLLNPLEEYGLWKRRSMS
jgi:hypothetical protein